MKQNNENKISRKLDAEINKAIGARIKLLRTSKSITQTELAERLNTEPNYISRIESGSTSPSIQLIYEIAERLECSVYTLMPPNKNSNTIYFPHEFGHLLARRLHFLRCKHC